MEVLEHILKDNKGDLIYLQEDPYNGAIKGVRLSDYDRIRIEKMGEDQIISLYQGDFFKDFATSFFNR